MAHCRPRSCSRTRARPGAPALWHSPQPPPLPPAQAQPLQSLQVRCRAVPLHLLLLSSFTDALQDFSERPAALEVRRRGASWKLPRGRARLSPATATREGSSMSSLGSVNSGPFAPLPSLHRPMPAPGSGCGTDDRAIQSDTRQPSVQALSLSAVLLAAYG